MALLLALVAGWTLVQLLRNKSDDSSATLTKTRHILCYGDSLTAGVSGDKLFPYATSLQAELQLLHLDVNVSHVGLPGWTTRQFVDVLEDPEKGLVATMSRLPRVDVVILWGGTNDMVASAPQEISSRLELLHQTALQHGAKHTLALTIPESGWPHEDPEIMAKTKRINENLWDAFSSSLKTTLVAFPFPYHESSPIFHEDGTHLTEQGYRELGEHLARLIAEQLLSSN